MLVVCSHLIIGYFPHGIEPPQIHTYICLSAQSIVHLTAQIQDMETRVANFFGGAEDLILVQLTQLIQNIATGETSQAITPFHFFDYFHFFDNFHFFDFFHLFDYFHYFDNFH